LILAARRSRNKSDPLEQDSEALLDNLSGDGVDDLVLQEAVGKLSPELRTAITLSYWAGLTEDEISRSVGCPRGTVASRIRRGKTQLRRLLQAPESSD
jgi:RNA polymerase sigma-70 factor (ECF subfamily)